MTATTIQNKIKEVEEIFGIDNDDIEIKKDDADLYKVSRQQIKDMTALEFKNLMFIINARRNMPALKKICAIRLNINH